MSFSVEVGKCVLYTFRIFGTARPLHEGVAMFKAFATTVFGQRVMVMPSPARETLPTVNGRPADFWVDPSEAVIWIDRHVRNGRLPKVLASALQAAWEAATCPVPLLPA